MNPKPHRPNPLAPRAGRKTRARRGEVAQRLFAAAITELETAGFTGFSLTRAAKAAGLYSQQAYKTWRTKAELIEALGDHLDEVAEQQMRQALKRKSTPIENLYAAVGAYIGHVHSLPPSALIPAVKPALGKGFTPVRFDLISASRAARERSIQRRRMGALELPRAHTRNVFLELCDRITEEAGRPELLPMLSAAVLAVVEGVGLQAARESRYRPAQDFIHLGVQSVYALVAGFMSAPRPS